MTTDDFLHEVVVAIWAKGAATQREVPSLHALVFSLPDEEPPQATKTDSNLGEGFDWAHWEFRDLAANHAAALVEQVFDEASGQSGSAKTPGVVRLTRQDAARAILALSKAGSLTFTFSAELVAAAEALLRRASAARP